MPEPGVAAAGPELLMPNKILIPLDGSEVSERILSFVDRLPDLSELELVLLHVHGPRDPEAQAAEACARLATLADKLGETGVRAEHFVTAGEPAERILGVGQLLGPRMVAMCSSGAGGASGLRGSVAEAVLERCPVPLLLGNPRSLPLDPGLGFARILVPLDDTDTSAVVLDTIGPLAVHHRSEVVVFHVENERCPPEEMAASLEPALERLTRLGVEKVRPLNVVGDEAQEIVHAIDAEAADLLAMTSHSRPDPQRRFFGSVTEAVLRHASCPLLVVRIPSPLEV